MRAVISRYYTYWQAGQSIEWQLQVTILVKVIENRQKY